MKFLKHQKQWFIVILFALAVIFNGCKHPPGVYYNNTPTASGNCSADTVYFQNDILPLLNSSCAVSGCHDASTGKEGVVLTDYGAVMRTGGINLQSPASSRIYRAVTGSGERHMPPAGYPSWTSAQAADLLTWISQGAKNNSCVDQTCDTTSVTFSGSVQPIFQKYCLGCHSGSSPSAGINLTNFTSIMTVVNNGSLMASIRHDAGYSPMPKGGNKLSDCEIATIGIWVNDTTGGSSTGSSDTTGSCDPDTVYFQNTILPLIQSNCAVSGCHDATSHREGVQLTDYAHIINTGGIRPGDPTHSDLYRSISGNYGDDRMPPSSRTPLTSAQIDEVKNWILQGALNNQCTSTSCDTTHVTFSQSVFPIIQTYCLGCHNSPSPSGGIYLRNYSDLVAVANNGKLWGSINHDQGYSAMPKYGNKLSDCNLSTIKIWINDGTPNN